MHEASKRLDLCKEQPANGVTHANLAKQLNALMNQVNHLKSQYSSNTNSKAESNNKSEPEKVYAPFSFEEDPGSNNSGFFDLIGVLTHKGRSSNSGHYVGWTKNQKTNQWYMYDDDVVTKVTEEEILKLSGGGDWHTAYVLFYGPRRLESKYLEQHRIQQSTSAMDSSEVKSESAPSTTTTTTSN